MKSSQKLIYFDNYGILRFDLGGRILLLFFTEIIAIWTSFILLSSWDYISDSSHGLVILIFNTLFLGTTFFAIILKRSHLSIYLTEFIKQICNLLFFTNVFLIIYYYRPSDIDEKKDSGDHLYFYTNFVTLTYIFILVYMICFYILFNSQK